MTPAETDSAKLIRLARELAARQEAEQKELLERANRNGWPLRVQTAEGNWAVLAGVDASGKPQYVQDLGNSAPGMPPQAAQPTDQDRPISPPDSISPRV